MKLLESDLEYYSSEFVKKAMHELHRNNIVIKEETLLSIFKETRDIEIVKPEQTVIKKDINKSVVIYDKKGYSANIRNLFYFDHFFKMVETLLTIGFPESRLQAIVLLANLLINICIPIRQDGCCMLLAIANARKSNMQVTDDNIENVVNDFAASSGLETFSHKELFQVINDLERYHIINIDSGQYYVKDKIYLVD